MSGAAGRALVVAGASGFLGAAVARAAVARGYRVVSLDRTGVGRAPGEPSRDPATGADAGEPLIERRLVDWDDAAGLRDVLRLVSPTAIVNCAGSSGRRGETEEDLVRANVAVAKTLVESAAEACSSAKMVLISSAAVYGPEPDVPTPESAPLRPATPYARSKARMEEMGREATAGGHVPVVIARPFNVLGPGEPSGSVVDAIASQILAVPRGSRVEVRLRECVSVRDYVPVADLAAALLLLAESGEPGAAYNICSGVGRDVRELVATAARAWGREADILVERPDAAASVSIGSPDKIRALGWSVRGTLEQTFAEMEQRTGSI